MLKERRNGYDCGIVGGRKNKNRSGSSCSRPNGHSRMVLEGINRTHQRRKTMMHRWLIGLTVAVTAPFVVPAWAQQNVPQIPYESVPNFLKLPPDLHLGEATGVAVNSKKHVFVFSRGNTTGPAYAATAAHLLELGPDGKFIREIGHNLYAWSFAHTVRVDKDDNIWAIDKGSDMIIRFNPEGRVTMIFGRKKEASDEGSEPWKH